MQAQLLSRVSLTVLAVASGIGGMAAAPAMAADARMEPFSRDPAAGNRDAAKKADKARLQREREARERAAERAADLSNDDGAVADIIVRGIRDSLGEARDQKRDADQIVDVIKAEDVGKLPANTVGDVVSYIPGIQVGRDEGEVSDIQLRGLGGVQTTINGAESFSSLDRNTFIKDLPADLVKSVEVYKTTTPSQVEGSGSGSININLRNPVDFKKGLSVFGIATARYNNQSKKYFQNYTGIANWRADTPIGPMGLLLNLTYNSNPYLESQAANDVLGTVQVRQITGPQILPFPTVAPSQVVFHYNVGTRTTKSYTASGQWKPTDQLSILIEGNYNAIRPRRYTNSLYMPVLTQANSTNSLPALSNIALVDGTNRIGSVTVSPVTQVGPIFYSQRIFTDHYYGRIAVDYDSDIMSLHSKLNFNYASSPVSEFSVRNRFVNRPVYDLEFASDKFKYPQMNLTFRDLNLLDPSQYRFYQYDESKRINKGSLVEALVDLTLRPRMPLIDNFQIGVRVAHRTFDRQVRARSLSGFSTPIDQMPAGYNTMTPIAKGFGGTGVENNARWLGYNGDIANTSQSSLYKYLAGVEMQRGVTSPVFGQDVGPLSRTDFFNGAEDVFAFYGQARYSFNLLFPIDGVVGARVINTMLNLNGYNRVSSVQVVDGANQNIVDFPEVSSRNNGLDVNPSASMNVHLARNFQLRLGYTSAIVRPRAYDLTPYLNYSESSTGGGYADGGNPHLKPQRTTKFDGSLEFYFGRTGIFAIAPFYWKLSNLISSFQSQEVIGNHEEPFTVKRPINAGTGFRRGVEVQGQTFFTFLPGILQNFGVSGNFTYVESRLNYPRQDGVINLPVGNVPIAGTAPKSATVMGLFERNGLSGRFVWNWRDKFITAIRNPLRNSDYIVPFSWMEANVSYRFSSGALKNLSIGAQAQNLGASARRVFYGYPDQPNAVVYMARTYGVNVRYSF